MKIELIPAYIQRAKEEAREKYKYPISGKSTDGKKMHYCPVGTELDEIVTSTYLQAVESVVGGAFARCLELKQEIADQEDDDGIADRSTIDRLSEAEKNYAELKEALQSLKQTKDQP